MKQFLTVVCLLSIIMGCFFKDHEKTISSTGDNWKYDSTKHFKLRAQKGVRSRDSMQPIGEKIEIIQQELLSILKESEPQYLEVYFLKDRETLTSYTGFPAKGYTDTEKGIIYFVDKEPFHLAFRHELMHALSWRLWGNPKGFWLSEGIAVFASRNCAGYDLHALAHAVSKQNKIVSFKSLTETFDFRSLEPSLQSASFVQYIYDNYGITALKKFWQSGLKNSNNIIDVSAIELEKRWRKYIDQEKFETDIDWDKIKQSGCE